MSDMIMKYNQEKFAETVMNVLAKNDPENFNENALHFGTYHSGYVADYKPIGEPSAGDITVYLNENNGQVQMHGNLQAAIPTIKKYYDLQDFENGVELTELRQAYGDSWTKDFSAMDAYISNKTLFDLSYNNPDIDWQIKQAAETAQLPQNELAKIDKSDLKRDFSVLSGYSAALSCAAHNSTDERFHALYKEINELKEKLSDIINDTNKAKHKAKKKDDMER